MMIVNFHLNVDGVAKSNPLILKWMDMISETLC